MDLDTKIIYALERISDAYKSLLWDQAKSHGISPIQIQILLFIASHRPDLCNVSHLAREFNVTKPTISDAVRVLLTKGYLEKDHSTTDNRSFNLLTTDQGKQLIHQISLYRQPVAESLKKTDIDRKKAMFNTLTELIYRLNQEGVLTVQRTCFACRFYRKEQERSFCNLLQKELHETDIRLDCPEYEERN